MGSPLAPDRCNWTARLRVTGTSTTRDDPLSASTQGTVGYEMPLGRESSLVVGIGIDHRDSVLQKRSTWGPFVFFEFRLEF